MTKSDEDNIVEKAGESVLFECAFEVVGSKVSFVGNYQDIVDAHNAGKAINCVVKNNENLALPPVLTLDGVYFNYATFYGFRVGISGGAIASVRAHLFILKSGGTVERYNKELTLDA